MAERDEHRQVVALHAVGLVAAQRHARDVLGPLLLGVEGRELDRHRDEALGLARLVDAGRALRCLVQSDDRPADDLARLGARDERARVKRLDAGAALLVLRAVARLAACRVELTGSGRVATFGPLYAPEDALAVAVALAAVVLTADP